MSGATLSSPLSISNAHGTFPEANSLQIRDAISMETTDMMDTSEFLEKSIKHDEDSLGEVPSSFITESGSSQEALSCAHCGFRSFSASEMKDHRWNMHPLLTRRKQHLMMSPTGSRKRPNSESSEDKKLSDDDDNAPTKKSPAIEITLPTHSTPPGSPDRGCEHVRRTLSSEEITKLKKKTREPSRHKKSASAGDLSTLRKSEPSRSAKISLIDSIATAPLAALYSQHMADCITNLMKPSSSSNDVIPSSTPHQHTNHPSILTRQDASSSKPAQDLHTLARAALSSGAIQSNTLPLSRDKMYSQTSSSVSVASPAASSHMTSGGRLESSHITGNSTSFESVRLTEGKTPQNYIAPLNKAQENLKGDTFTAEALSYLQPPPTGLFPHLMPGYVPQCGGENSIFPGNQILVDPSRLFTTLVPNYIAAPLYPGVKLPMCVPSQAFFCGPSHLANNNLSNSPTDKLSTLSDVASRLLTESSQNHRGQKDSRTSPAPTCRRSSTDDAKDAERVALAPPCTQLATSSTSSNILSDSGQTASVFPRASPETKSVLSLAESNPLIQARMNYRQATTTDGFSSGAAKSLNITPHHENSHSSSTQSKPSNGVQVMDDERVRSLEEALQRIDCCDPNERSSILPFRCPDGKWRMVRTKRIGGAWLVQMPGTETPSVYLPPRKDCEENGETLNAWLKDKLAAFSKPGDRSSPPHTSRQKSSSPEVKRSSLNEACSNPPFTRFTSPIENIVPTDAIRSLLLRKTAA